MNKLIEDPNIGTQKDSFGVIDDIKSNVSKTVGQDDRLDLLIIELSDLKAIDIIRFGKTDKLFELIKEIDSEEKFLKAAQTLERIISTPKAGLGWSFYKELRIIKNPFAKRILQLSIQLEGNYNLNDKAFLQYLFVCFEELNVSDMAIEYIEEKLSCHFHNYEKVFSGVLSTDLSKYLVCDESLKNNLLEIYINSSFYQTKTKIILFGLLFDIKELIPEIVIDFQKFLSEPFDFNKNLFSVHNCLVQWIENMKTYLFALNHLRGDYSLTSSIDEVIKFKEEIDQFYGDNKTRKRELFINIDGSMDIKSTYNIINNCHQIFSKF